MDEWVENPEILREILNCIPVDIYYKDRNGKYRFLNRVYEELRRNRGLESALGKTDDELMPTKELAELFREDDKIVMETGQPSRMLVDMPGADGVMRKFSIMKEPVRRPSGEVDGLIVAAIDVTEDYRNRERIQECSVRDYFTGLYNRNAFEAECEGYAGRGGERKLSLLWLDVDNLKCVNDVWGHEAGDRLIRSCAQALQEAFREIGRVFRVGGDEYAVLFEGRERAEVMEGLRQTEEKLARDHAYILPVSISAGYAQWQDQDTVEELLQRADQEMYRDKKEKHRQGRERIRLRVIEEMEKRGVMEQDEFDRMCAFGREFCEYLMISPAASRRVEEILIFFPLTQLRYSELQGEGPLRDENKWDKNLKLMYAVFQSVNDAAAVLYVELNWNGEGNQEKIKRKEIPYYSRVARVILEVLKRKELPTAKTVEALCQMSGRELDPALCEQMCSFLSRESKASSRARLISCLCRKYQTNTEGLFHLMEELPYFMFYKDVDGCYQLATNICMYQVIRPDDEAWSLLGKTDAELFPEPEIVEHFRRDDCHILQTGESSSILAEEIRPSGERVTLLIMKHPVFDNNQKIVGICGIIHETRLPEKVDIVYHLPEV